MLRAGSTVLMVLSLLGTVVATAAAQAPAGGIDLSAGGFLKVHGLVGDVTDNDALRGNQELWVPHIPLDGEDYQNSHGTLQARTSRLWIRARGAETPWGRVEVLVEGDLMEDMRDYRPRLRHAYMILGRLLVGQTWSTFVNTAALADVDSGTAVGNSVTRHQVLRWTQPISERFDLQLALEEPLNRLHYAGQPGITSNGDHRDEDLILRLDTHPDWGTLSIIGLWREVSGDAAIRVPDRTRHGSAFSIAGRINTGELDNLRFALKYGNALARHSTLASYPDAVIEADGRVTLNTVRSFQLAWQHYWRPEWRSSFALGYSRSNLPESVAGDLTRSAFSAQANLIRSFGDRWSLGVEYLHGRRSVRDGRSGNIDRLQLTLRVNF